MKKIWKAVFVTVLFLGVLSFLTMEKISYIWTLRAVGDPAVSVSTGYSAVLVLLVSPYILAFLQGLWNVSFLSKCSDTRLPPVHNILLGVLSSVLEPACLVWFTCLVAPSVPVFVLLPAMSGVLAVSAMSPWLASPHGPGAMDSVRTPDKGDNEAVCPRGRQYVALASFLGPALAATILYLSGCLHWLKCVVLAGTLVLLAVMWTPGVLHRTFNIDGEVTHNCRRLGLIYTAIRITSVFFFVGVDLVAFGPRDHSFMSVLWDFFSNLTFLWSKSLMLPLLMNIVSGLFSHGLTFLSLAFCQPVFGMLVPSVVSTVTSIALCVGFFGPYVYHVDELGHFGELNPFLLSGGVLAFTWAMGNILCAFDALHRPGFLFMPYEDLLLDYGWCPGFSDLRRLLSYRAGSGSRDDTHNQPVAAKKSRIYVCTTMYREADYEMERLLLSLQRLSGGEGLEDVYMEAHIFMDNGINDTLLGDFAEQLVGLLLSRLGMNPAEVRCLLTPYGLQLTSFLSKGMPLFVHLKDPAKVKAKKRWSQCMYINYIMNFRKTLWKKDDDSPNLQFQQKSDCNMYVMDDCSRRNSNAYNSSASSHRLGGVGFPTLSDFTSQFSQTEDYGVQHYGTQNTEKEPCTTNQLPRTNTQYDFKFDPKEEVDDDHTYILATDADMDFEPKAVAELLNMCNSDHRLGAACGRTHPIGKHCSSIVWHQIFEYAKDFWMIKSAQNVIGSVMCCPGCFSLYRASAIRQVMDKYATPTRTPFTVYVKDTGEDRWMATLMMINGWRLRYSAFADNTTYCPDSFQEFFKQRRRWILSDIANLILVVQNMPRLLRNNQCFSLVYVLYLLNMFMNNVITPGTAIVMITAGMELVFDVPYIYTTPPLAIIVYSYAFFCTRFSTRAQTALTSVLTLVLGAVFSSVAIWGSYKIVNGMVSDTSLDIQEMVTAIARPMIEGSLQEQEENAFWETLRHRLLGNDVNTGLQRTELADRLEQLRNRSLFGLLIVNALWLAMLSYFYVGIDSPLSRLNLYGLISGALYGFTLVIQVIGMTVCRVNHILIRLARYLYGDSIPMWVYVKEKTQRPVSGADIK